MTAAQKALDALEAAGKSGECPPWDAATLATNLSSPLAAVARAAMEWRETADAFDADFTTKNAVNLNASEDALRAALDALESEARKLFGKETT